MKDFSSDDNYENEFPFYDSLPAGCLILNGKGRITYMNQAAGKMLGLEKEAFFPVEFLQFILPEDQKRFLTRIGSGSVVHPQPFDIRLAENSPVKWVKIHVIEPAGHTCSDQQTRLMLSDMDALKHLEQENQGMKLKLQQVQKMEAIGELSSGIAHDFNNILHPIIGNLEMLIEDSAHDWKLQRALKNVLAGAQRAGSLVKQILDFNRPVGLALEPVKLQPILREVLKLHRSTMPFSIKTIQTLDKECGPVLADPTHIYQIAINLITNASHAMGQSGGILDVSLKQVEIHQASAGQQGLNPGIYACLSVRDTGPGIDAVHQHQIFQPYFTTKKNGAGTGLGLFVISEIVKNYGGDICFSSELNKGTVFQVYFPVVQNMDVISCQTSNCHLDLFGTESILFVDDDPCILGIQEKTFKRYGYKVTSFLDSLDALAAFKHTPDSYDIVICDMSMAELNGLLLAQEIKRIEPDIPVIICTGFSEELNQENFREMGVDGFLLKPVRKEESLEMIRSLLNNR